MDRLSVSRSLREIGKATHYFTLGFAQQDNLQFHDVKAGAKPPLKPSKAVLG